MGSDKEHKAEDWCSKKGMKRRRKGMYTIETKMRKWCYCASFAIVCIVYFIIGGLHAQRSVNANKINVDFSDPVVINSYDACRYP